MEILPRGLSTSSQKVLEFVQVLMPGLQGTWRLSESSCLNQALVPYTIMNVVSVSFLCLSCCVPTSGFYRKCHIFAISYQYVQKKDVHIHGKISKNFSVPPVCRL
jgi:hypothetical protein